MSSLPEKESNKGLSKQGFQQVQTDQYGKQKREAAGNSFSSNDNKARRQEEYRESTSGAKDAGSSARGLSRTEGSLKQIIYRWVIPVLVAFGCIRLTVGELPLAVWVTFIVIAFSGFSERDTTTRFLITYYSLLVIGGGIVWLLWGDLGVSLANVLYAGLLLALYPIIDSLIYEAAYGVYFFVLVVPFDATCVVVSRARGTEYFSLSVPPVKDDEYNWSADYEPDRAAPPKVLVIGMLTWIVYISVICLFLYLASYEAFSSALRNVAVLYGFTVWGVYKYSKKHLYQRYWLGMVVYLCSALWPGSVWTVYREFANSVFPYPVERKPSKEPEYAEKGPGWVIIRPEPVKNEFSGKAKGTADKERKKRTYDDRSKVPPRRKEASPPVTDADKFREVFQLCFGPEGTFEPIEIRNLVYKSFSLQLDNLNPKLSFRRLLVTQLIPRFHPDLAGLLNIPSEDLKNIVNHFQEIAHRKKYLK